MSAAAETASAEPSLADVCAAALADERFADVRAAVAASSDLPQTPAGWFEFCANYSFPHDQDRLRRLKARTSGGPIERYAALNALLAALERVGEHSLTPSIRRQFEAVAREWAAMAPHWADHFDLEGYRFVDIVRLASLNRFLAGDVGFEFMRRLPYSFIFRCHPLNLPGLLAQVFGPMRGAGPALSLHFNYARRNQLILPQKEFERALWRMAKVLERNPELTGVTSNAWFHSEALRETFPRLVWMRDLFLGADAYAVDLEPGHAEDIGHNSAKRKELYDAGKFMPRHTLVLWPRASVLAWAAARADLADADEAPIATPAGKGPRSIPSPRPRPHAKANSPLRWWDGAALRHRYGLKYWAALLGGPSLLAAAACGFAFSWIWAAPAFILAALAMLTLQYYVSQ
jgi:hypothetical protein